MNKKQKQQLEKIKWYQSSENSAVLSLSIKAILWMIVPASMKLGAMFFPVLNNFDAFVIANELAVLATGIVFLYGLVRRIYNLYFLKYM